MKYCADPNDLNMDGVRSMGIVLATGIGSVTATGSLVAYGKLDGSLDSSPMNISGRDQVPPSPNSSLHLKANLLALSMH